MSGLMHKVKEAITGKEDTREAEAANQTASGTSHHGHHGHTGAGTAGSDYNTSSPTGSSTTTGPHSSSMANKADPRVDSDLNGSRTAGMTSTGGSGLTSGTSGSGLTGGTSGSSGYGTGTGSSTIAGPHSSNLANKADPRVDSDLDGSRGTGMGSTTGGSGLTSGTSGTSGHGTGMGSSTTTGPHSSNLANKADPRVDSDLDGSRNAGMTGSGSTASGLKSGTSTHHPHERHIHQGHERHHPHDGHDEDIIHGGAHHTNTANKLDPHVEGAGLGSTSVGLGGSTSSGVGHSSTGLGNTSGLDATTSGVGHSSSGLGNTSSGLGPDNTSFGHSSSGHGHSSAGLGSTSSGLGNTGPGLGETSPGYGSGNTNTNITTGTSTTTGPHKTAAMNEIDPRGEIGGNTGSGRTGY